MNWVAYIAGKPAPTVCSLGLHSCCGRSGHPAPSECPWGLHSYCGSQLAGDGIGEVIQLNWVACIAGKPAPTECPSRLHSYCGSQLAGDGIGEVKQLGCVACIAGKPAPTVCSLGLHNQVIQHPQSVPPGCTAIVGASLLAMVSVRSSSWAALPVSPASARTSDWASAPSTSADGGRAGSRCRTGSPASPRPCVRCACAAVP